MSSFCKTALKSPFLADKVLSFANHERFSTARAPFRRRTSPFQSEAISPKLQIAGVFFYNSLTGNIMRRRGAFNDAGLPYSDTFSGDPASPPPVGPIALFSYRSLIRTSIGPLISIIRHISLPVH